MSLIILGFAAMIAALFDAQPEWVDRSTFYLLGYLSVFGGLAIEEFGHALRTRR